MRKLLEISCTKKWLFKLLTTIALFLSFNLYAHHSSNCDALKDYDFSKFEDDSYRIVIPIENSLAGRVADIQ